MNRRIFLSLLALASLALLASAAGPKTINGLALLFSDDFEKGMEAWKTTDVKKTFWKIIEQDGNKVLRVTGKSDYEPPVRSPHSIAMIRDLTVGDFVLTARIQNTNPTAGAHRDLCFFWGYQDPSHFYYAHLGAKPDPHACQIFIVDNEPRTKITVKEAKGTPWTDGWHDIKVVRRVSDGVMEIYFDNMDKPHMTACDKKFTWGSVGVGTFDDNGNFDNIALYGVKVARPIK